MQEWTEIRRKVLVEGVPKRQIIKEYGIGWRTLEKALALPEPPGYRKAAPRAKTKIGPFTRVIEQILITDRDAPPKQHHTSKRIFERLRDEYGYAGGITQVKETVASYKRHHQEVFMPLSHPPGRAQFDFGFALIRIAGVLCKAALAVMSLPYSDAFHYSAYPRENTETFQAAHVAAFAFFGGVPRRTDYDNSKIAVKKIIGRERELTSEFLRLESHYLFDHHFCHVRRGNEKGVVEGIVGYGRRNFLVPVPSFETWADANAYLEQRCRDDLDRRVRGKTKTKAKLLEVDRAALLPLPAAVFEARRVVKTRANSLSLVRFDRNDYSVPTAFAHHEVTAIGGIEQVRIACGSQLVAVHPRCWDKERITFDPRHYLALLERKPGAFDFAKPLENWELPGCFALLRRRLEASLGDLGTREYIKVLRLLEGASVKQLAGAVEAALGMGAEGSDAISCILHQRQERPVALFSLDGHPHLKPYAIEVPDLSAYAVLEGAS
jgi:transposase